MATSSLGQIFQAVKGAVGASATLQETSSPKEARHAFDDLVESIKKIPVVGKVAGTAFDMIGKAAGVATGAVTSGFGAIAAGAIALTAALAGPLPIFQQFGDQIGGLVKLANPGAFQQFQYAMQDAWAVLGGQLTPVLQGLTILARAVGDHLAHLTPVVQPLFDKLGQAIANIATGVGPVVEGMSPIIEQFIDVLVRLTDWFSRGVALWQGIVAEVLATVNSLFGLKSKRFDKDANSQGAAVRGVNVSSTEQFSMDVFRRSVQNAFGTGQGKKPEEHIPEIAAAVNEGKMLIREIRDTIREIGLQIITLLPGSGDLAEQLREEFQRSDSLDKRMADQQAGAALKK